MNVWLTRTLRPAFTGRVLPATEDILLKWRLLLEDGRKIGYTYSHADSVLAATALHHGLTVVTRDRGEFDKAGVAVFHPGSSKSRSVPKTVSFGTMPVTPSWPEAH